jgi:predicted MFS family arabinose efflux permease
VFWGDDLSLDNECGGNQVGADCGILNTGSNVDAFIALLLTRYIASFVGWSRKLYARSLIVIVAVLAWLFLLIPVHRSLRRDCQLQI